MATEVAKLSDTKIAKLINSMPEALREANEKLSGIILKGKKADILWRYDVGDLVTQTMENETEYGENPVEKLADANRMSAEFLYQCQSVTKMFSKPELVKLTEENSSLCWNHITILQQLEDKARVLKLIDKIESKKWSVRELLQHVKSQETTRRGGKRSGRPPSRPSSAASGLQQVISVTGRQIKYFQEIWSTEVFDPLEELDGITVTDKLVTSVHDAKQNLEIQLEQTRQALESIRKIEAKMENSDSETPDDDDDDDGDVPEADDDESEDEEEAAAKPSKRGRKKKAVTVSDDD